MVRIHARPPFCYNKSVKTLLVLFSIPVSLVFSWLLHLVPFLILLGLWGAGGDPVGGSFNIQILEEHNVFSTAFKIVWTLLTLASFLTSLIIIPTFILNRAGIKKLLLFWGIIIAGLVISWLVLFSYTNFLG